MNALAFVLASLTSWNLAPGVSLSLDRTQDTRVTFSVRDRGASAGSVVDSELLESLPTAGRSFSEFVLRGVVETPPDGWSEAAQILGDDPTAKIGLAHAMELATGRARDPVRFTVRGNPLPPGTYQERDYGLRAFDLNLHSQAGPIRVARYWFPESQPLGETPVIGSGYRFPDGTERRWTYCGGGWRLESEGGILETEGTPAALSVERTGIDLNNVRYRIRNNTDEPVTGVVLPGQVLVPSDPMTQRMVTIKRANFTVPASGQIELEVPAACLDIDRKEPTGTTSFRAIPNDDPVLANLVNLTNQSPLLGPWNQAAYWIHTNGASMEQINERLGMGVSPLQYQQAAAQVAMHGGLDPLDSRFAPVWKSLAEPRSILMGMYGAPGLTSVFAPSLGSIEGGNALRAGAAQVPQLLGGMTLTAAQQESVGRTAASLLTSGDAELEGIGARIVRESLGGTAAERLPEVQTALEFARHSPNAWLQGVATGPEGLPKPSSLFGLATCLNKAEEIVATAVASTVSNETLESGETTPGPFEVALQGVPETVAFGESVSLSVGTENGTPMAVSYGVRTGPGQPLQTLASERGGAGHVWKANSDAPSVVQLTCEVVSTEGRVARTTVPVHVVPTISANIRTDIANALRRAREAKARETRARTLAEQKRQEVERLTASLRKHWSDLRALQTADRDLLDGLEAKYRQAIEDLLKRNEELAGGSPPVAGNVDKAAEDAQKAADDCEKEMAELRQQKANAEKERDDLRNQLEQILAQINAIYQGAGFTGGSGFHASGTAWFGYVREGGGLPPAQSRQVSDLQRQMRAANRQMRAARKKIEDLDAKIKAKEEECAKLKKRNEEAQQAKANKDEIAANNAQIGKAWDDLAGKLESIEGLLGGVEGGSGLAGEAGRLRGTMPTDKAGWDRFWERLRDFVNRKKRLEAELERKIQDEQSRARDARDARDQAESDADEAEREAGTATAEAGALQEEANKQPPTVGTPDPPSRPPTTARNPCMEKFAVWLKKYQDKMTKSQLEALNEMMLGAAQAASVPGVAVGEAIAGGSRALAQGAGSAAAGMNALASGFLSLGAGLFYAYAQNEIAKALGPLGSKIRVARVAALAAIDNKPCGEVGAGGVTGRGSESFFYFKVGGKLIVFRGGESGVEFVGVGDAM